MKEWFKARNIWGAAIMTLTDEEAGRLMKALWGYTMTGQRAELSGAEKAIYAMIQMTLDQDRQRDEEISAERARSGSIGGRQRAANQAKAILALEDEADQVNDEPAQEDEADQVNAGLTPENEANQANACNKNKNKNKSKSKTIDPPKSPQKKSGCTINSKTPIPRRS